VLPIGGGYPSQEVTWLIEVEAHGNFIGFLSA
jgi:hypothetical protein